MKAALIPPIPHLNDFGQGEFHLLLTHLLTDNTYKEHYINQRRKGAYLVLDNSAHEKGKGEPPATLLKAGFELDAQEIVVPDVLFECEETIEACLAAHEAWFEGDNAEILDVYSPAFMYVPQGKNEDEWSVCLDALIQIHAYCSRKYSLRRDLVLGVSKDYDVWDGGLMHLIDEYVVPRREALAENGITMQVHLLGWMRELKNLSFISEKHPWIRSTDSAKPFVYALSGVSLVRNPEAVYPTRPEFYFHQQMSREELDHATDNVWYFRSCALGNVL